MHEYRLTSSFPQISVLFFLLEREEASSAARLVPLCGASREEGTSWNRPAFAGSSTKRFSSILRFFSSSGTETKNLFMFLHLQTDKGNREHSFHRIISVKLARWCYDHCLQYFPIVFEDNFTGSQSLNCFLVSLSLNFFVSTMQVVLSKLK